MHMEEVTHEMLRKVLLFELQVRFKKTEEKRKSEKCFIMQLIQ